MAHDELHFLLGGIGLLFVSSAITMAIPFALGKVIDIIYGADRESMTENLKNVSVALVCIFIFGAACNFGRTYLMGVSGTKNDIVRAVIFNKPDNFGMIRPEDNTGFEEERVCRHSQTGGCIFRPEQNGRAGQSAIGRHVSSQSVRHVQHIGRNQIQCIGSGGSFHDGTVMMISLIQSNHYRFMNSIHNHSFTCRLNWLLSVCRLFRR